MALNKIARKYRRLRKCMMIVRFMSYIRIGKPNECWEWQGCSGNEEGHGYFRCDIFKTVWAHIVAYKLFVGKIPRRHGKDKLQVCHSCDNPPCCNPDHLFLGTARDNKQDMLAKGRGNFENAAKGEAQGLSKLTWKQVKKIRKLYKRGFSQSSIARRYNVRRQTIGAIIYCKTWKE